MFTHRLYQCTFILLLSAIFFVPQPSKAAPSQGLLQQTQQLIEELKQIRQAATGQELTTQDAQYNCMLYKRIDPYFDLSMMAQTAIAPHKKKLLTPELKDFQTLFQELIRSIAYPSAARYINDRKYTTKIQANDGQYTHIAMNIYVPEDDLDIEVIFVWQQLKSGAKIVDLFFDGSSLIKDYQNQFGRTLEESGSKEFLRKLREKNREEKKAKRACTP